jgi:hypothetical protein
MEQFELGDSVRLKSGGPLMTVSFIESTTANRTDVGCIYFLDNKLMEVRIYSYCLKKDSKPSY